MDERADLNTSDFWRKEQFKFVEPHYRLQKTAKVINRLAGTADCDVLDVGCGPGTLGSLLRPTISYFGLDFAIESPTPNLHQLDLLAAPIDFEGRRFDFVVAQGVFEYLADQQDRKIREISEVLTARGKFLVSYTNFSHRRTYVYEPFNNIRPISQFRDSLESSFRVERSFPASHNWNHVQPRRDWLKRANMHLNANVPLVSPKLAVEYYFLCSPLTVRG